MYTIEDHTPSFLDTVDLTAKGWEFESHDNNQNGTVELNWTYIIDENIKLLVASSVMGDIRIDTTVELIVKDLYALLPINDVFALDQMVWILTDTGQEFTQESIETIREVINQYGRVTQFLYSDDTVSIRLYGFGNDLSSATGFITLLRLVFPSHNRIDTILFGFDGNVTIILKTQSNNEE